jgi:hypothetical protein
MTVSQRDAAALIRQRKTFKAGNVFAEVRNGLYVAYSYGNHYPLAVHHPERGWFTNITPFSISTSYQKSKLGIRTLSDQGRLTTELLQMIAKGGPEHQDQLTVQRVTRRLTRGEVTA